MKNSRPLADRMRPSVLEEFVGQDHLLGNDKVLNEILKRGKIPSMIFWGPPGTGKTTLANIIVNATNSSFVKLSAIESGTKEIKQIAEKARNLKKFGKDTIVFIDEIHRFNKSQQDTLLPFVENGTITLIGATTENPSFQLNSALLSRSRVFVLNHLENSDIEVIIKNALVNDIELKKSNIDISDETITYLSNLSNGDARNALNVLELSILISKEKDGKIIIDEDLIKESVQRTHLFYDKNGEQHYNLISALHKSMRGSDVNASLYWLGRMLEAGEDPLYVARRVVRFASEDIGLSNPDALPQAVAAYQACQFIGMPECAVNLAQAVAYMAKSKKGVEVYKAYNMVKEDVRNLPNEPVPLHLRNAPTKLMKELGYKKGYKYTPDYNDPDEAKQDYLPDKLKNRKYIQD